MATFGPAMSKVMCFRKTTVVLFSDRIKGTASTLACIVLDRSLEAILAIRFCIQAILKRIIINFSGIIVAFPKSVAFHPQPCYLLSCYATLSIE